MSVSKRHEELLSIIKASDKPISGTSLSEMLKVSRQIIVQDVNQLKASGYAIIATPKGYIYDPSEKTERIFKVHHDIEDTEAELNMIVDLGAKIKDVFIYHRVYGEIHGDLSISSRRDVRQFVDDIASGKSSPLMTATAGYHYHTIVADSEEIMNLVEQGLKDLGFYAELTDYEPDALLKYTKEINND